MLDAKAATVTSMNSPIVTGDGVERLVIDSTSDVVAATAAEFSEHWQTDQDEIRTFDKVYNSATCSYDLVPDCSGTLENINPYVKGLLGNFRNLRTMVCYGPRSEADPTQPTNLPQNGYIAHFSPYWNFGSGSGLEPNTTSPLWIESVRTTRVNAQGLELETRNALGIYTSAQYGYNKTLPIAVTNNAPYYQMAYEGFEDSAYRQSIDNTNPYPCLFHQVGFIDMPNTHLVNTDTTDFSAHTGKYCLAIQHNGTGLNFFGATSRNYNYTLQFGSYLEKELTNIGDSAWYSNNSGNLYSNPYNLAPTNVDEVTTGMYVNSGRGFNTGANWKAYLQITAKGTYHFSIGASDAYSVPTSPSDNTQMSTGSSLTIVGLSGGYHTFSSSFSYSSSASHGASAPTVSGLDTALDLCPGIYQLNFAGSSSFSSAEDGGGGPVQYQFSCSDCPVPIYRDTASIPDCSVTTPIPGSATMMNPTFGLPANTKMVFSAWVREDLPLTATGADTATGYNNAPVYFTSGNHVDTITPAGPVIDGWQRYEGCFTPASSSGYFTFANSNSYNIYVDDIRLHPFNAEMKSYIYDPVSLRLAAELDDNNYATFYEYDAEGTLVRTKAETQRGIQTIKETRSAKQKNINTIQ
jgi:hypothetical protein